MTQCGPCGCECDHEEEKDMPQGVDSHECCGGGCCGEEKSKEHNSCGCGCEHEHAEISPEELENLKKAILEAGYKIEETPEGDIRILEK